MTSPALMGDAMCRCRHFLAVPGGRGHAGDPKGPCTHNGCDCKAFTEDAYRPMNSQF